MSRLLNLTLATVGATFFCGSIQAAPNYKGDFNSDGKVDLSDMAWLATRINESVTTPRMDLNADGKVDDSDLHCLADIIISGKLTTDSGLNVGIGGWDDNGEDFGGVVGNTRSIPSTRSAEWFSLSISDALYDFENCKSVMPLGVNAADGVTGVFLNLSLPSEISIDPENAIEIIAENGVADDHQIYGKPVLSENGHLKFIVFSPRLLEFKSGSGKLLNLKYIVPDDLSYNLPNELSILDVNGNVTASSSDAWHVRWNYNPILSIEVPNLVVELNIGDNLYIPGLYSIIPDNATDKSVEYTVSGEGIISLRDDMLFGDNIGEATLTISALDGSGCQASIKIVVKDPTIYVSSIIVNNDVIEAYPGDVIFLPNYYSINPQDANNPNVEYTISDESVASIDGELMTMNQSGETILTISALDGSGCKASIKFIVKDPVIPIASISVSSDVMEVLTGNTISLTELYTVNPDNATDKRVEYSVSDAAIATIEGDNITFNKSGEVTLTIYALDGSGCQASIRFIVKDPVIPIASISVSSDVMEVLTGSAMSLTELYTVNPDNATDKRVEYSVSDAAIATVEGENITFNKSGEVTLTISALDGSGCQAQIHFIVKDVVVPVSSISVSNDVMEVLTGNSMPLTELYTVNPENATDKRVEYSVSDAAIATVEGDNISFNKSGEVILTISALDGSGSQASIYFVVKDVVIPVSSISVSSDVMEVLTGSAMPLTELYTVNPDNATDKRVEYSVSDASIATVEGDNISFNRSGKVTLTISALDGSGCQAQIHFIVKDVVVPVSSISVSSEVMEVLTGNTISLTELYTVNPDNATDKRVEYSVSDAAVATVEGENITFNKSGEVILTISALDGSGCQASIRFIVKDPVIPVSSISVSSDVMEVLTGSAMSLTELYIVNPDNATDKRVEYSVSDAAIATVEGNNITFNKSGEVTLTISALDGSGCQASIRFIVKDPVIPIASISVSSDVMEVLTGNTISLTELYTVNPENATDKRVEYSVSDAAVATIEGENITFNKSGEVILIISALDGSGCQASIRFIVKDPVIPVSSISVSSDVMEVLTGSAMSLTELYTVNPDNATDKRVEYSVSDAAIATVEGENITFNRIGEVTLTISALDGSGCQASIRFIVKDPVIPVSSISVSSDVMEVLTGSVMPLTELYTVNPDNATDKRVEYSVSDAAIATVEGDNLSFNKSGEVTLTISALDGSGCQAAIRFIVKDPVIPVLSLDIINADTGELIPADGFSLEVGNGIHLGVKFTPENATDKRVEWSSSDERVATVTQDGYLEIRGEGNAQIKAKSLDGSGIEATFRILGKSGIDSIFNDPDAKADVYNLRGILVISQASASDIETLPNGTYILHTPRTTVKIRK